MHLYGFVVDNAGRASDSVYIGEWSELPERFEDLADNDEEEAIVTDGLLQTRRSATFLKEVTPSVPCGAPLPRGVG